MTVNSRDAELVDLEIPTSLAEVLQSKACESGKSVSEVFADLAQALKDRGEPLELIKKECRSPGG